MTRLRAQLARLDPEPYEWWRAALLLALVLGGIWEWYDAEAYPWIPNACEQRNMTLTSEQMRPCGPHQW